VRPQRAERRRHVPGAVMGGRGRRLGAVCAGLLVATASASAQPAASAAPLTLGDVVKRVLAQHPDAMQSVESVQQRELGVRAASATLRPNLLPTASGALGRSQLANQNYGVTLSQRLPYGTEVRGNVTTSSSRNQLGTYYFTDTTLLVSQPLLRGFGKDVTRRAVDAAETALHDARRQHEARLQQLALDAAGAYIALVGRLGFLRVAERAVDRASALRDESAAKLAVGRVSQLDVLRAEQLLAQARAERLNTRAGVQDAEDQLRLLMNEAPDFAFAIVPVIPVAPAPPQGPDALALAHAHRHELAAAQEMADAADRQVRLARRDRLPRFDVQVGVTRQDVADRPLRGFGLDGFQAVTFASVAVPVFNDQQDFDYQVALIERGQRVRELAALRNRIAMDVRRALREVERSVQSAALARDAVELARREVEVAQLRFTRGLSSNVDVVSAEAALLAAESAAIAADGQATQARLAVLVTTGTLDPSTAFP
jgi:outer membrane protein TolC